MRYVSPEHSKLLYGNQPLIAADGVQAAAVKVRLRDHLDRPVANIQTELVASRTDGVTIQQPDVTDTDGLAIGYVRATTEGPLTISARVFLPE